MGSHYKELAGYCIGGYTGFDGEKYFVERGWWRKEYELYFFIKAAQIFGIKKCMK